MGDFPNYRILIVDDDRDFAAALSAMLIDRGYAVETAVDGAAAGEVLGRFAAEAALIGLRPDGGDSPLDPMAEMRRRQPDMVCVMVSDFTEVDTVLEAGRAGADDCLSKPIDPPLLFATLKRCIANRKRLRISEQRFRDITEASSDWFWEMDEDLRFSYFSDRFSEVTGVPHDSLLGKTREETGIPDVDAEAWQAHLADLAAHRSFRNFHHTRTRLDGSLVHLSVNGQAIFDEAGKFLGYRGVSTDITERILAEEALRAKSKEIELLRMIAVASTQAATVEDALQTAVDMVCNYTGWPVGHAYLTADDGSGKQLPTSVWRIVEADGCEKFRAVTMVTSFAPGVGLPGRVFASGQLAWIKDVTVDPNFPRRAMAEELGIVAAFGFPMLVGAETTGVLVCLAGKAVEPDVALLEAMAQIGPQRGRVIERKRAETALRDSDDRYARAVAGTNDGIRD